MTTRVIADWIPDGKGGGRTRYTLALYGGIVTELSEQETITNALYAYNVDMQTPPAEPGGDPRTFPTYAEEVYDDAGKLAVRRPAPLWLAHGNVQDGVNQSQQAVRGGV